MQVRGVHFQGLGGLAHLSPFPFRHCFARSDPLKKGWNHRPTKHCVYPIADGWGVWLQWCHEVTAPFWVPRSLEGRTKHLLPLPTPRWLGAISPNTPDPLEPGGSPSQCWTTKMKQRQSIHTQAVQPSYNWAKLSMLVASLMTKSTCEEKEQNFRKQILQSVSYSL